MLNASAGLFGILTHHITLFLSFVCPSLYIHVHSLPPCSKSLHNSSRKLNTLQGFHKRACLYDKWSCLVMQFPLHGEHVANLPRYFPGQRPSPGTLFKASQFLHGKCVLYALKGRATANVHRDEDHMGYKHKA